MVVVLSAYGRDRWAFQHTEQLFHPQLSELHLPIDNYYVRKIQATYALMDWLAYVVASEKKRSDIDIWKALSSNDRGTSNDLQPQRYLLRQILEELLRGQRLKQFQSYLSQALDISQGDILLSLLWGDPRSLLFEVIPTLIRQLATNWQSVININTRPWTDTISNNPMPDFMPPTLFSDLNVSEIVLHIPERHAPIQAQAQKPSSVAMREDEYLSLALALNEFAPGHVNKRHSRKALIREAH